MNTRQGPALTDYGGELDTPVLTCLGCVFHSIVEGHYSYCAAQPVKPNTRIFPNVSRGTQLLIPGQPNTGCPYKPKSEGANEQS